MAGIQQTFTLGTLGNNPVLVIEENTAAIRTLFEIAGILHVRTGPLFVIINDPKDHNKDHMDKKIGADSAREINGYHPAPVSF